MVYSKPAAQDLLQELENRCMNCNECSLREGCRQVVFGEGNPEADLMLIGEGPGAKEDELGRPFVGAAGKLLDRILAAINLKREDIYIGNIIKCRPPQNRTPTAEEAYTCLPFLEAQVAIIKPKVIVCMGSTAAKYFLNTDKGITELRGNWVCQKGLQIMPTYHPAALLRDTAKKKPAWIDFKNVYEELQK